MGLDREDFEMFQRELRAIREAIESRPAPLVFFRKVTYVGKRISVDHESTPSLAIDPQHVILVEHFDTFELSEGHGSANCCKITLVTGGEYTLLGSLKEVLERLGR